jgi:ribonuclease P protein component
MSRSTDVVARRTAGGPSSLYRKAGANPAGPTAPITASRFDTASARAYPFRPLTRGRLHTGNKDHETHLSAEQNQEETDSRIPCPDGDQGRPAGAETPSREGPGPVDALSSGAGSSDPHAGQPHRRLPRKTRLTASEDFSRVFRRCIRSADRYFTVLAHFQDLGHPRLGLAVSRKSARRATSRNRIKRLVRESFRHGCDSLPSADIVVISRPPAAEAGNQTLTHSLETHWRRLRARRPGER